MTATATRYIQLGGETTAGTAVAADTIWAGEAGSIEDLRTITFVTEHKGRMSPSDRQIQPKLLAGITFPSTVATYEQIVHVFEAGIETDAAAACGSGYLYEYNLPTTTTNTLKTYTVEAGDSYFNEEMEYSHVTSFSLSGAAGGPVMVTSTWRGRQKTSSAKTGALTVPATNEPIYFGNGKVYINDTFASLGVTQKTETLVGFKLDIDTGLKQLFSADGARYFTKTKQDGASGTLEMTLEMDATPLAERVKFEDGSARYVRLQFDGTALQTTSAPWLTKALRIDCYGKIEKVSTLDSQDGNDVQAITLRICDNQTNDLFGNFYVVTSIATVP